jgi:tetratricopeptide (TPR) repeat protein
MAKTSVVKVLLKANSHEKNGEIAEARKLYQKALQAFPKNKNLKQRLANLTKNSLPISNQSPSQEIINQLIYIYDQGQFVATEEQAKIFTKKYPKIKIGWTILGVTQNRLGKIFEASQTFKNLTKLDPYYAEGFINFGITTQMQGNLGEAIEAYKKALSLKPDYAAPYYNMGNALKQQGNIDEAIEAYKKALSLKPNYAEAYNNMGSALNEQNNLDEAIKAYKKALSLKPNYAEAYNNMGNAFKKQNSPDKAIEAYKKALSLKPDYAEAYNNFGIIVQDQGKLNEAIEAYKKALSLKPDYAEAYFNMGDTLRVQGKLNEAIEAYKKVLLLKPDYAEAYYNIGLTLYNKGKLDEAIEAYNNALSLRPDYTEVYNNIGLVLDDKGKLDDAIETYAKVLSLKPNHIDANWNQSLALLSKREFGRGWAQYEKRWERSNYIDVHFQSTKPRWEPNRGGSVLVWLEQGLGDLIMFSSIIPELYKQSKKLIVQTDDRLIPLFIRSFPSDIIYYGIEEKIPEDEYDYHIPIGSLPLYFRTDLQSFKKNNGAYLKANNIRVENLKSKLLSDGSNKLIGISWHSTNQLRGAQNRGITLKQLTPILQLPKTKLISLQYGDVKKDIDDLFTDFGIKVHQITEINNMKDIDDLASLITACDSIISIDNSTIHLAGALGKKSKLLLPYSCDWRWGRGLSTSYWYNSVELYHQTEIGNWDQVLSKL